MFDFANMPKDDARRTAYGRYLNRKEDWELLTLGHWTWRLKHKFWWLLHNCVVHPLIGFFPFKKLMDLHDWSSKKLAADHIEPVVFHRR